MSLVLLEVNVASPDHTSWLNPSCLRLASLPLDSRAPFRLWNLQKFRPGVRTSSRCARGSGIALMNRRPLRGGGKLPLRCHYVLMPLLFLHSSDCDGPGQSERRRFESAKFLDKTKGSPDTQTHVQPRWLDRQRLHSSA